MAQIFEFTKFQKMMSRSHRRCRAMVEIAYREIFVDHGSFKEQQAFILSSIEGEVENESSTNAIFKTSDEFLDRLEMTEDDGVRLTFRAESNKFENIKTKRVNELKKMIRYLKILYGLESGNPRSSTKF